MSISGHKPSGFFVRVGRICTRFPIRDTSYLTAIFFWIGAAFFAVNGFFYVFMTTLPQTDFATEATIAIPVTSCLGDFFFFLGCSAAVLEALNIGRGAINGTPPGERVHLDAAQVTETPKQASGKDPWPVADSAPLDSVQTNLEGGISTPSTTAAAAMIGDVNFIWFPTIRQLRQHYMKDLAFIASAISWTGIIFFTIATIVFIPGVADLNNIPIWYYGGLLQTFLGGTFFFVAAFMQMTLTQRKWYIPAPYRLAWYVGFWNSVGSIGFALGGALWYGGEDYYWSATLASFWGAWGWFIGSSVALYIIMDRYP